MWRQSWWWDKKSLATNLSYYPRDSLPLKSENPQGKQHKRSSPRLFPKQNIPLKRQFLHLSTLFHVASAKAIGSYLMYLLSPDLESFMSVALHGNMLLINRPMGVWLQHAHNAGQNASMEDNIQNSYWANRVRNRDIFTWNNKVQNEG